MPEAHIAELCEHRLPVPAQPAIATSHVSPDCLNHALASRAGQTCRAAVVLDQHDVYSWQPI
jgi:hypothetical protein